MLASLTLALTLARALLGAPDLPEIPVRAGAPIVLDGEIAPKEWDDAFSVTRPHPDGGSLRLAFKRQGPWLAIALSGDREYAGETLWLYSADASRSWVSRTLFSVGRPAMPPALWLRIAPDVARGSNVGPGEAPRACRVRANVAEADGWSVEYLLRVTALGIGRADTRDFRGMFRVDLRRDRDTVSPIVLPDGARSDRLETYARLVSKDGWGADESWAPVAADVSLEFDDHELLHRLFLEHEQVSQRMELEQLVIANSIRPRSDARIRLLRSRLEAGRARNPALPAWTYFLGRLLHEANLFDDARTIVEEIPAPLRKFDPFINLRAEHYLDTEEFAKALEVCDRNPRARGVRETRDFADAALRAWGAELRAIARDKAKTEKNPRIRIHVRGKGTIDCELFEDDAPFAVRNFMELAWKRKYYDGLTFHEVIGGAVARTGDPRTRPGAVTKVDGPPWRLRPDKSGRPLLRGYLGTVPVEGSGFHGSQFVIAAVPLMRESQKVTVFGRVVKGLELAETLEQDDRIERIEVLYKRNHAYDPLAARLEG